MTRPRCARDSTATRARDRDCDGDGDGDHQRRGAHSKSGHSAARERARSVVVGGEEGVDRFVQTVLLVARWCVGRNLVDVRRRVIREVATRLLATQGFLACLSDEAIFYEHYKQREPEVRRDAQQAVCGFKLRLVEIVRARKPEVEGRGRLQRKIHPAIRDLTHATRSLLKPGLAFF